MQLKTSYFNTKIFLSHIYSLSRTFEVLVVYFEILYSAFAITFPRKTMVLAAGAGDVAPPYGYVA
jgi:hypothetical protein